MYLFLRLFRRRAPLPRWLLVAVVAAGPLSVVALIAGWITTEVGRQPWIVYDVMRVDAAVTGASDIPIGYGTLSVVYVILGVIVFLMLRRLARVPLPPDVAVPGSRARGGRSVAYVPVAFILAGMTAYTVLAGADFGAGLWTLLAVGRSASARRLRDEARHAMGPVWEANHVWLIFVLVIAWTAYPVAYGSITSTLAAPLLIAAIGIIFRGAAYALRGALDESRLAEYLFALSSVLTPFALGTAIGAIAIGRVPVGNALGQPGHFVAEPGVGPDRRARGGLLRVPGGGLSGGGLAAACEGRGRGRGCG